MKHSLKKLIALATVCVFVLAMAGISFAADKAKSTMPAKAAAAPKGLLDGKHFMGEVGTPDKTTGDKENITFKNGQFHSSACEAKGFGAAPYTATEDAGVISFKADLKSATNGTISWTGSVKGDALEASATLTQEGKDPVTMWAKGTSHKMSEHKSMSPKAKAATKPAAGSTGQ